jgi:GH24 family phage-related lysozyme (muramidase)
MKMPPTPNQFMISPEQVQIQAPQIQEQVAPTTFVKEGEVSMASPREMIGGINTGMDWYAIGAKAFEVAGNVLPRVLDYQIEKKGAEIADAIYDAETKIYDSYTNQKASGPQSFGGSVNNEPNDIGNIINTYETNKNELKNKIDNIFGFETSVFDPNFKFDGFGSRWFGVIDGARRGYKNYAEAGERVQRDALLTLREQQDKAEAWNIVMSGGVPTQKQTSAYNDIAFQNMPDNKSVTLPLAQVQAYGIDVKNGWSVDEANGTATLVDPTKLLQQPEAFRKTLDASFVEQNIPYGGNYIPEPVMNAVQQVASTGNIGTLNPRVLDFTVNILPQLNENQLLAMQKQGKDISEAGMNRLRTMRYLAKYSNKSNAEVVRMSSSVNMSTLDASASIMGARLGLATAAGFAGEKKASYTNLEKGYSAFFIEQANQSGLNFTEANLNEALRTNPYIKDAYVSGLLFWMTPNTELDENTKTAISRDIIVNSFVTPSTYNIQYQDETTNQPIVIPTGLSSVSPLFQPSETTRLLEESKGLDNIPVMVNDAMKDTKTGRIRLAYAANLAMTNLEGNIGGYTETISNSFDSTYNLTRELIPTSQLKTIVEATNIEKTDPTTGQTYDAGITKAILYKYSLASSDQVLTYFNGGRRPQNPQEISQAFYRALEYIPTADQWGWQADLSQTSSAYREKTMGNARVNMKLTDIPVHSETGVSNLMANTQIIPAGLAMGSIVNPSSGQPISFYADPVNEDGFIDINDSVRDFQLFLIGNKTGIPQNKIKVSNQRKEVTNPISYFTTEKIGIDLEQELKTNILVAKNRNTNNDSIIIGTDESMDSKSEFVLAVNKQLPFLLQNAQDQLKINKLQAQKIYSILGTEAIDSIYERNRGKPFVEALADITLSTRQFINNDELGIPMLPPIDSNNNDVMKEVQSRVLSNKQKVYNENRRANAKQQIPEFGESNRWEWNYDTQSWDKVSKETNTQDFTSNPNFKYGGMIGWMRDLMSSEETPNKEKVSTSGGTWRGAGPPKKQVSPGAVSDKPYIKLISEFEGLKTEAYWDDTGKVWTIGKGTTKYPDGTPVKKGDKISKQQAEEFAQNYVDTKVIPTLEKTIPTWNEMNPNQQAALVSFAYNLGENFYGRKGFETLTKALSNVDTFDKVPDALKLYNKSGGKKLDGLVRRRKAEADLWLGEVQYSKKDSDTQVINVNDLSFEYQTTTKLQNIYENIYGKDLANKLIENARVSQKFQDDSLRSFIGQNSEVPNYEEDQLNKNIDVYTYSGEDDINFEAFYKSSGENKGKIFTSKRSKDSKETLLHELTHSAQKQYPHSVKKELIKDLPKEILDNEQDFNHLLYVISPTELPAHIAEYKAFYYKDTNRVLTSSNIETEMPKFIDWLGKYTNKDKENDSARILFKVLNETSKDSSFYKLFKEVSKQVALINTKDSNTKIV